MLAVAIVIIKSGGRASNKKYQPFTTNSSIRRRTTCEEPYSINSKYV